MQVRSPWLGLVLAVVHAFSGLSILLFSSWFIAACAVAGVGFNYMLPAVIIRALALIRIASGYAEMWVGHNHLLRLLAKLRLKLFNKLKNQAGFSTAEQTDKLTFQTEAIASIWVGWVAQNASAWLAMTALSIFTLIQLPVFSWIWLGFVVVCTLIYSYLVLTGLRVAKAYLHARKTLECEVEHYVGAAPIWHMYNAIKHPKPRGYYNYSHTLQKLQENANIVLLGMCLLCLVFIFGLLKSSELFLPIVLVLPMAVMAAPDWFGRIFMTQNRLLDYLLSQDNIDELNHTKVVNRYSDKISYIQLSQFTAVNAQHQPVSLLLKPMSLVLLQGSSGVGKSRLLQSISGLLPHMGEREVNAKQPQGILDDCIYIEQQPYCLSATLRDNLKVADANVADETLDNLLTQLNLTHLNANVTQGIKEGSTDQLQQYDYLNQWVGERGRSLSGGELKRLGLARAMLSKATFILLDEPFEGLDQENIQRVVELINQLATTKGVVVASHIMPESLQIHSLLSLDSN